jgi:transporter family-2 protein
VTRWWLIGITLLAGAGLPLQAGINAQLIRWAGHAITSALVSFAVGTACLAVVALASRVPWPAALAGAPAWAWMGGPIGAVFVAAAAVLAPKLGAAFFVGVVVAGQMVASILLDHFGVLGFARHPVSAMRLVGALLLVAGVALIRRF